VILTLPLRKEGVTLFGVVLMIELLWWHWAVFGMALVLSELLLPTFVLVWFGLGGIMIALALFLIPAMLLASQILLWTVASLGMTFLWFRVFKKGDHKSLIGRASAHIEGEVGMIMQDVAPFQAGKIRFQKPIMGSDLWECRSEVSLSVGTRAKVVRVEGNSVFVTPVV